MDDNALSVVLKFDLQVASLSYQELGGNQLYSLIESIRKLEDGRHGLDHGKVGHRTTGPR